MIFIKITFIILACLLTHIVHECGHMLFAKISGEKIIKTEWFKNGGTRVFYENEPKDYNKDTPKKWAFIAFGGYASTIVTGYLMIALCYSSPNYYIRLFAFFEAMICFISDGGYFILGSIGNGGDVIGIRDILGIPKPIMILLSVMIFAVNMLVVKIVFY